MNERIALLKSQCIVREQRGTNAFDNYMVDRFDTEKFAELIVRECIREIGYKSAELLDIDFYPHYQERLKKYFGVNEQ